MPNTLIGYGIVIQDTREPQFSACELWSDGFGRMLAQPLDGERFTVALNAAHHLIELLRVPETEVPA